MGLCPTGAVRLGLWRPTDLVDQQRPAGAALDSADDGAGVPALAGAPLVWESEAPLRSLRPLRVSHHLSHDRAVLEPDPQGELQVLLDLLKPVGG